MKNSANYNFLTYKHHKAENKKKSVLKAVCQTKAHQQKDFIIYFF